MNNEAYANVGYIINKKTSMSIKIFLILLVIITLLIIYTIINIKFPQSTPITAIVKEKELIVYIPNTDLVNIENYQLYLNKIIDFNIISIQEKVMLDNKEHYEVIMTTNINENLLINNNVIQLILIKDKETILNLIKEKIKWL